jgi:Zn-dependent protease with chaperone function
MNGTYARAIAPALAMLLLAGTAPATLATAQTAPAPPASGQAPQSSQPQASQPQASPPSQPQTSQTPRAGSPGSSSAPTAGNTAAGKPVPVPPGTITISDEKMFTQCSQASVEGVHEYGSYDNPAELARINRIGYELAQQTDFYKFPITFTLINMAEPNAFSLACGEVFVARGILDLGLDDDMVANLLGHEIGHVIKEHYLHRSRRAMLMSILGNLLVAGVLISGAKNPPKQGVEGPYDPRVGYDYGDGNRVQGAAAASLIISELMLRSFSREQEDEADEVGQQLAAAAGYDPDGARRLWVLMRTKAPQIREYGYLQTHPFAEERTRAAEARKGSWSIQKRSSADRYRQQTQDVLVAYAAHQRVKDAMNPPKRPPVQPGNEEAANRAEALRPTQSISEFIYGNALSAWPRGKISDEIRLARLHRVRDTKLASCPDPALLAIAAAAQPADTPSNRQGGGRRPGGQQGQTHTRIARLPGYERDLCVPELHDYGAVIRAYRKELAEVQSLDPMGPVPPLVQTLSGEISQFEVERQALYPHSEEIFKGGVYETPFLVAFLSNFPDAPEVPEVALSLGEAYSRTGNETEAVDQYLTAWKAGPDSPSGHRAATGLRNLTPSLKELSALQELADQQQDADMRKMAGDRLATVSHTYDDVSNGAEYLRRFPDGSYVIPVLDRLNVLADNLYGEVVLYQGFGDPTKASDRINKILTNAPLSPAAEKLRDRAVLVAEKNS